MMHNAGTVKAKVGPGRQTGVPEIPTSILRSPLMRRGGFDVFTGIADENIRNLLLDEALAIPSIRENIVAEDDGEEVRGGSPKRRFLSSGGGEFQRQIYQSDWLNDFLRSLTTPELCPTGEGGTYSHYSRSGDFLAIHRDIVTCDVALITCLRNEAPELAGDGGKLCLYPGRIYEPLSSIRKSPERGMEKIALEEGQTLVFYGGIIPHALLPVAEGQVRTVSVLCFSSFPKNSIRGFDRS